MTAAVIVCGGAGTRMGNIGINKTLLPYRGKPLFIHSAQVFHDLGIACIVAAPENELSRFRDALNAHHLPGTVVSGGVNRFFSVLNGLKACPDGTDVVLVHDGARPFITQDLVSRIIVSVTEKGSTIPVIPSHDTMKIIKNGTVESTPDRSTLLRVQTPQGFRYHDLLEAYSRHSSHAASFTDDASVMEASGCPVYTVEGLNANIKITTREDYDALTQSLPSYTTGLGQDTHRLTAGRDLILCGVRIPYEKGLDGHSDADVAVHALMDAILGAAAMGDIGHHFPDKDPAYKGISSLVLLQHVMKMVNESGYALRHADITIQCQRPKLAPYISEMRAVLAQCLGLEADHISVKATTTEGLGYEGRGEGISALAVATLSKNESLF